MLRLVKYALFALLLNTMFAGGAMASLPRADRSLPQLNPAFGHSPSAFGLKSVHRTLFRAASPNALDQLTGYTRNEGTTTPEVTDLCYDGSGNLSGTSSTTGADPCTGPVRAYTHDANNRMTGASDTITAMSASYVYGAEDTRIYKQDGSSGRRFSMNGNMVLGEHPGSVGSALGSWTLYIPGLGIDDRVAMVTMSGSTALGVHFYLPNRLGSVIGMVGGLWGSAAHGTLTDQYLYSPYGVEEPLAGSGNMFRYTGRYYDGETGLYYYRSRYYSAGGTAGGGRFLQPDSILYDGGLNLYSYVGGNPINNVDPLGTSCLPLCSFFNFGGAEAQGRSQQALINSATRGSTDLPSNAGELSHKILANAIISQGEAFANAGANLAIMGAAIASPADETVGAGAALSPMARGLLNEAKVLGEMGLAKNTTAVISAEGRAIPDALTKSLSVEIKDTICVSCTQQIRIQTEAAAASGRTPVLVTGTKTHVTQPAQDAFKNNIVRRPDLGPQ